MNLDKEGWLKPPTLEQRVEDALKASFERLNVAFFGGEEEFQEALQNEAKRLLDQFQSPKTPAEIKIALENLFNIAGDPENKQPLQSTAQSLIESLELRRK